MPNCDLANDKADPMLGAPVGDSAERSKSWLAQFDGEHRERLISAGSILTLDPSDIFSGLAKAFVRPVNVPFEPLDDVALDIAHHVVTRGGDLGFQLVADLVHLAREFEIGRAHV